MRGRPGGSVGALFALFTLSGFTGLLYESLWSHYLKLFLGAAAFAQSFVLVAFMGGMALGAWLASRWSARLPNLLAAYAGVEALIGIAALGFDPVYAGLTRASLDSVFPALGSPIAVEASKYLLCAVLTVPQSVLLGMTFPLMSGAVLRRAPGSSGHHLALLYFTNSIGAALGALAVAFWLLDTLGLPGTMQLGGAINLALAALVLWLSRRGERSATHAAAGGEGAVGDRHAARLLLAAAFITGAASFIYEIVWIRMISLVLGSSFQAFELMLSAFITGLALGGLWARRIIDRIGNPLRFGGYIQVAMGLAALATIFVYHASFDWMAWALSVLQRDDAAYPLFNLFSHAIAFAVMLPATVLAGVTLPLFTHALLSAGHGERAIGQVYAANTLGAIAGVLVAVHVLMPQFGLKLALILGAMLDILLGAWLLRQSGAALKRIEAFAAVLGGMLAATLTARAAVLEPERLASGVFRYGKAVLEREKVAFYRDGKTASIATRLTENGAVIIATNGKPDASIRIDPAQPPVEDEYTMVLLGALPLLLRPDARTVANIGFGSGLTAEVLLSHTGVAQLDTVEIEPAMVAGARHFAPRVTRPFLDSRSRVHFEDAKSFFARHDRRYDVIISEPSNPWVNGVASLFSTEFYREARRHLAPRGVFVQWLQQYEFEDRLVASIAGALAENFRNFEFWEAGPGDLIAVAVADGPLPRLEGLPAGEPAFLGLLGRYGITHAEHVAARRLGDRRHLLHLLAPLNAPVNSDFRPIVQLEAARARFVGRSANAVMHLASAPLPVAEMLGGVSPVRLELPMPAVRSRMLAPKIQALVLHQGLVGNIDDPPAIADPAVRTALLALKRERTLCGAAPQPFILEQLQAAAELTLVHLTAPMRTALWEAPRWTGCPLQRMAPQLRKRFELYAAIARRDGTVMLELARDRLAEAAEDEGWRRYALLAGMLGAHAAGDAAAAKQLWTTHSPGLYRNVPLPPEAAYLANWPPQAAAISR